jgi:crotonobetainyl-CoA:carnitine CoA-transferase CaiB-like acyl-CoA transferase
VSGLQHLWNYPEDEEKPAGSTAVHPDHFVGRIGVVGVLAGLIARERTGRGCHLDGAQFEAAIGLLADLFAQESLEPGSVRPQGNASSRGAPWGCYECEGDDEWCVINVRSDSEWQRLRKVIGDPEWAADPSFDGAEGRIAESERLDAALQEWTRGRDPRSAMEALQAAGIPCGIVAHPAHHLGDPQMAHRGYLKLVDQQAMAPILVDGSGFLGSDLPEIRTDQAPMLGEHTRDVARRLLGLSDDAIQELVDEGVIEDPPAEFKVL